MQHGMDPSMRMMNLHESKMEPSLPPGFRFHPTDEELISHYLTRKVMLKSSFTSLAIAEVDLNKCEPWDLKERAKMGEKELYFFTLRDRKYPTGMRTNRATEAGYWKATGKDRDVISSKSSSLVGMKKTLVFYQGRAPKGEKTNWIMHEYRLDGEIRHLQNCKWSKEAEWVVCRIFQKMPGGKKALLRDIFKENLYSILETHSSLPPLLESPIPTATTDPEIDSDSGYKNDHHLSSFFKVSNYPSYSNAKTPNISWDINNSKIESSARNPVGDSLIAADHSCGDSFDIGLRNYCPSYVDIYNPNSQNCEASTSSNNATNYRQNIIFQESLGSTSSTVTWRETGHLPKVLDEQYSTLLERAGNARQCKPEPYDDIKHRSSQYLHKNLDQNDWVSDNNGYEMSHSLQLQSSLTPENSINELYGIPAAVFRNIANVSGVELDCLWGNC